MYYGVVEGPQEFQVIEEIMAELHMGEYIKCYASRSVEPNDMSSQSFKKVP